MSLVRESAASTATERNTELRSSRAILYLTMEKKKSTVNNYPMVRLLGKGTFGEVYLSKN